MPCEAAHHIPAAAADPASTMSTQGDVEAPPEKDLCLAKGQPCWLNVLCCPFVLIFQSSKIYLFACCWTYVYRSLTFGCCFICRACCKGCYLYSDKNFPPNATSVGALDGKDPKEAAKDVVWQRAEEWFESRLTADDKNNGVSLKLFEGGVEPKDIAQGGLGDCWLMSAMACMAEHQGLLRTCFISQEFNERGKYQMRIFDGRAKKWTVVTVDDNLPVKKKNNTLLFAQPNGNELWVLLIEKAFAKFCGDYASLDGGHEIWAFEALTGDPVFALIRKPEGWTRMNLVHMEGKKRSIGLRKTKEVFDDGQVFGLLRTYLRSKALLTASISSEGEVKKDSGLVAGHAYSVLDAKRFSECTLIQLRNPWGTFEWKGAWSDGAPEWDKFPKIKRLCRPKDDDDGSFWMPWEEFLKHFDNINLCSRSTGVHDLYIDLNEGDGFFKRCFGPTKGCCWGCTKFWLMCKGCRSIYGGKQATRKTSEVDSGMDDSLLEQVNAAVMQRA